MKHTIFSLQILFLLSLLISGCGQPSELTAWPAITNEMKPWTRWWWMGSAVDSSGITYNMEALARAGLGGVEITPIYGVKGREAQYIDYLSPKWPKPAGSEWEWT